MTKKVVTIRPEETVMKAVKRMMKTDLECLPVTESKTLQGIVTFRDIVSKVLYEGKNAYKIKVKDVMSKSLFTCHPNSTVLEVVKLMKNRRIRRVPVVNGKKKLIGIVTSFDLAIFGWKLE